MEELLHHLLLLSSLPKTSSNAHNTQNNLNGAPLSKPCKREITVILSDRLRKEVSTIHDLAIRNSSQDVHHVPSPALKGEILVLSDCKTEDEHFASFIVI